ncbi:lytic transglycosylase domain-containing protein [Actibacterium sp.]|uniref:lytic transglycosylase domain-containing protein n=1 Tax=Actibacterium sp. TaxID=1872125 RepID=UPI00356A63BB
MRLVLSVCLGASLALWSGLPARSEPVLVDIMQAVRADEWDKARILARPQGQIALDIVDWRALRAGQGVFDDYLRFLSRNPDWPGLDRVRAQGEGLIPDGAAPADVIRFFADAAPLTGQGGVRLALALAATGRMGEAQAQAALTWVSLPLSETDQSRLLAAFGPQLKPLSQTRLDTMLWRGETGAARLMLPLVDDGWRKLAEARLALRGSEPGVDTRIAAVPAALADDPGLAYERFLWRLRKGRDADAAVLLDERSLSAASLGLPEKWAGRRHDLARAMMRDGQVELAYRLAANHYVVDGSSYAELEWLAGFIALRQLNEPAVALSHFQRFETAVDTPISLGRAGYWQGRAYEALGQMPEAQAAYAKGAVHQTSFYGQLAAEKAGVAMDPALTGREVYPDWTSAGFAGSSVLKAGVMLAQAGERNLAEWFLTHLAETAGPVGQAQLAGLALAIDEPHLALRIAKLAAGQGTVLPRAYFPVTEIAKTRHPVPPELMLSIARRESEFDPGVSSGAGARGLMQLMPGTAKAMAKVLEIDYAPGALLSDPGYNARLGGAYLAKMVEEFGANYVLVAAAYNAGPSRARRWINDRGDPRSAGVDVVDWIESIPFDETRNYVMRVTESITVYQARLKGEPVKIELTKMLKAQ